MVMFVILIGCDGVITSNLSDTITLRPGDVLRLNCTSTTGIAVAWYFTGSSGTRDAIFFNDAVNPIFMSQYRIEAAGDSYELVAQTNQISSYCGFYECIEDNGGGTGRATSTVSGRFNLLWQMT